jgi:hypothetical protein
MSKEVLIKDLQQNDSRQCSPDSPSSSDGRGLTMEEVRRRQREVRIDFLATSRPPPKFHPQTSSVTIVANESRMIFVGS